MFIVFFFSKTDKNSLLKISSLKRNEIYQLLTTDGKGERKIRKKEKEKNRIARE